MVPAPERAGLDLDAILARSRIVTWEGRILRIPGVDDLLVIACLHVFGYHVGDSTFLLRHLADLSVAGAGCDAAWERWERHVPHPGQRASLRASRGLLDGGIRGRARAAWYAIGIRSAHWAQVLRMEGSAPRTALRVAFPPRSFMEARYKVPRGSPLVPLLYVWRPLRGAWAFLTGKVR